MRLVTILVLLPFGALAALLAAGALATLVITLVVEARYPPLGRFVAVPGGRIATVEAGPTRGALGTVVLLHGASSNAGDMMVGLGRPLAEAGYRVVALDRPGFGWSDRIGGSDAASPAVQARSLAAALDALGVGRALVVGHSWSGALAVNLALDHPDHVAGLVLLAPVTHPWPGAEIDPVYRAIATGWVGRLLTLTVTAPAGAVLFDRAVRAVFQPQAMPEGYADAARLALILRPGAFWANAQDVAGLHGFVAAQAPRHRAIRVPTVVIAGDSDPIVHTDIHARAIAAEVEGARLLVLPGVGHMLHQTEVPTIVAEIGALATRLRETAAAQ